MIKKLTLLLFSLVLSGAGVMATNVDHCQVLNSPGTYDLNQNIASASTNCIDINSSNVIFDGHNFSITGANAGDGFYGIGNWNKDSNPKPTVELKNIEVKNTKVQNFLYPVSFAFVMDSNVHDLNIFNNIKGMRFYDGNDFQIYNNWVQGSNTSNQLNSKGIYLTIFNLDDEFINNNHVYSNVIQLNDEAAIQIDGSYNNVSEDNNIFGKPTSFNTGFGFFYRYINPTVTTGNVIRRNWVHDVTGASEVDTQTTVVDNNFSNITLDGGFEIFGDDSNFSHNIVSNNRDYGTLPSGSLRIIVADNNFFGNSIGIQSDHTHNLVVSGNSISDANAMVFNTDATATVNNNTINSPSQSWVAITNSSITWSSNTFQTQKGKLVFGSISPTTGTIARKDLNINDNNIFFNTTTATQFNTTTNLTFYGLGDFNYVTGYGNSSICSSSVCGTVTNLGGGTYTMTVQNFNSMPYSIGNGNAPTPPKPISASSCTLFNLVPILLGLAPIILLLTTILVFNIVDPKVLVGILGFSVIAIIGAYIVVAVIGGSC